MIGACRGGNETKSLKSRLKFLLVFNLCNIFRRSTKIHCSWISTFTFTFTFTLTQNTILLSSLQYSFCIIPTTRILPEALPLSLAFPSNKRSHLFYCIAVHCMLHTLSHSQSDSQLRSSMLWFFPFFVLIVSSRLRWSGCKVHLKTETRWIKEAREGKNRLRPEGRMREARREVTKKAGKPPNTSNAMHLSHTQKKAAAKGDTNATDCICKGTGDEFDLELCFSKLLLKVWRCYFITLKMILTIRINFSVSYRVNPIQIVAILLQSEEVEATISQFMES